MNYQEFINTKRLAAPPLGLTDVPPLHPKMFPFQRAVTEFLLRVGRGAAFLDTGLGKTIIQLEWSRVIAEHTGQPVLILAPLAVAAQTVREAEKFGIGPARVARDQSQVGPGINVTNYERIHLIDPKSFGAVVLDESSILKAFSGKTTRMLIDSFKDTRFKLCCTATPAPNDHMEMGNHVEFLGLMNNVEMLSRWFINDSGDTGRWRLKGHAESDFWDWVASWARCISKPSDLGYDDAGFNLPPLNLHRQEVRADLSIDTDGLLFRVPDSSATSIHREKRRTMGGRADLIAGIVAENPSDPWIVWCDTNYEADELTSRIPDAVEIRGNMTSDMKETRLIDFAEGRSRVIVTKPSIAGHGLNFQHCAHMAFVGLSFSYESFYQAVRRCWRFGQKRPVEVHIAMADTERTVWDVVSRKAGDHNEMKSAMVAAMKRAAVMDRRRADYNPIVEATWPTYLVA